MRTWLARLLKVAVVALLIPSAAGLLLGVLGELERMTLTGRTFRDWMTWGFATYLGVHLLLYRPVGLFRASHRLFSLLAVWFFGGQVASVEGGGGGGKGKGRTAKGAAADPGQQGSTLVAFSPYVVPLATVLVCLLGWPLQQTRLWPVLDGPLSFGLGATMAFHWVMTADALQAQRSRWHVETYLLALSLVFILTILIAAACLPGAVPGFSFVTALGRGLTIAQELIITGAQQLFF